MHGTSACGFTLKLHIGTELPASQKQTLQIEISTLAGNQKITSPFITSLEAVEARRPGGQGSGSQGSGAREGIL